MNDAPARRPTLRDVAQLAGVSIGTASNVLTGRRVVAPETRRAVEKAVATLDYRPDVSARALISRRARNAPPPPPDRPRLLCVGYLCADHLARVPALPRRGERTVAASVEKMLGGRAANVAVTAAGLGGDIATAVQLLTVTGDDADSDWAAALLAARRVALAPASRQPGARLSRALVLIEHDGERAIVNERLRVGPPALSATLAEMEAEMEAGAGVTAPRALFLQGDQLEALAPLARHARARGWRTALQLGATDAPVGGGGLRALSDAAFDLVFLNREAAAALGGADAPPDGDEELAAATATRLRDVAGLVVLTLDAGGAAALRDGVVMARVSAPPTRIVDETGAGDAFAGCFLGAWLNGADIAAALAAAVRGGSAAVESHGAQEHGLTAARILLETYKSTGLTSTPA